MNFWSAILHLLWWYLSNGGEDREEYLSKETYCLLNIGQFCRRPEVLCVLMSFYIPLGDGLIKQANFSSSLITWSMLYKGGCIKMDIEPKNC